jgi:hypothetical protein
MTYKYRENDCVRSLLYLQRMITTFKPYSREVPHKKAVCNIRLQTALDCQQRLFGRCIVISSATA